MATSLFHPQDTFDESVIKEADLSQLPAIADELRRRIQLVDAPARGDFSPNDVELVELSLGLQRVFDCNHDRIVWETTPSGSVIDRFQAQLARHDEHIGRPHTLIRQRKQRPQLLPEVPFSIVPAGRALASALGLADARTRLQQDHWIVVVADAESFARGMKAESAKHFQTIQSHFLVIIPEIGEVDDPAETPSDDTSAGKISTDTANADTPNSYEAQHTSNGAEFGLNVCHFEIHDVRRNLPHLVAELERIRSHDTPTVLRLRFTRAAIEQTGPVKPPAFLKRNRVSRREAHQTRVPLQPTDAYAVAAADELKRLAAIDSRISIIATEPDLFPSSSTDDPHVLLLDASGRAVERDLLMWCSGLAAGGCKPVVMTTELALRRHLGQLANDVSVGKFPILFVVTSAGGSSQPLETGARLNHLAGFLRLLPNMAVMAPSERGDLMGMLNFGLNYDNPSAILLPHAGTQLESDTFVSGEPLTDSSARLITEGCDVALLAIGSLVEPARLAASQLEKQGISVAVVNTRFIKPLDAKLLPRVTRDVRCVVIAEEAPIPGGLANSVFELLAEHAVTTPVAVMGASDWQRIHPEQPVSEERSTRIVRRVCQLLDALPQHAPLPLHSEPNAPAAAKESQPIDLADLGLSSEHLRNEGDLIQSYELSDTMEDWIREYELVGERTRYLWLWCAHGLDLTTIPSVAPELRAHLCDTKLLAVILGVMLDDVADQQKDSAFLENLLAITFDERETDFQEFSPAQQPYARFTHRVWRAYRERTIQYPDFGIYNELLNYDHRQIANTMRYSQLINENLWLLNQAEHDLYLPHNMQMMSFSTLDLMCVPNFRSTELGKLREAIWHAQCMGRIGNMISTWQREIGDRDFTSGVFARAIVSGDLTFDHLKSAKNEAIERIIHQGRHEEFFLNQWKYHRKCLATMRPQIRSFDLGELLHGLERLLPMELVSRGLK